MQPAFCVLKPQPEVWYTLIGNNEFTGDIMRVELYSCLPLEAVGIRERVFVEEQGFRNEFDCIDSKAVHFVLFDDGEGAIGTCRVYKDEQDNSYVLGRLAVTKENRGKNAGALMVKKAEEYVQGLGGKEIKLHAQCRVSEFYKKLGFSEFGGLDDDEGCPHIWMIKRL